MTASMDISSATGVASHSAHPPLSTGPLPDRGSGGQRTGLTLLILVFVGFISLGLPDGLLGVAWPSIRQTFGLPLDALGALFLTTVCGYLVASLASSWVVDRIGVGMLLALSAVATATSLLTFALAPGWGLIILAGILAGLGGGAIDAGLNSYVALAHSPRFLSWLHACFGVGAATGPAIMIAVQNAGQPWNLGYAIVGGGQLLLGLCFLLTRRQWQVDDRITSGRNELRPYRRGELEQDEDGPAQCRTEDEGGVPTGGASPTPTMLAPPVSDGGARSFLRWPPAVWLSIVLFLVYTGIETTAGQWAYTLFVEERGISAQIAGIGVSAYWGGLALGRVLGGLIADRIAPATLTRWSMVGMLVGAVMIWLDLAVWLSFAGLVLMGLSAASVFPSLIGVTPSRFGAERAATIIGFQIAAASLGITGLPSLSGVLAARIGLEVIPVVLVIASLGMLALHESVLRLATRTTDAAAPLP
jgi:fucose permease